MCSGKPLHSTNEANLIHFGRQYLRLEGEGVSSDKKYKIEIASDLEGAKNLKLNSVAVRLPELIRAFPVVSITPDEISLIFGSPSIRRKFLDLAVSQTHPSYLNTLQEYQKVLDQRNRALKELSVSQKANDSAVHSWDEQLVDLGSEIVAKRLEYLAKINPGAERHYSKISGEKEKLLLEYRGSFYLGTTDKMAANFVQALEESARKEIFMRQTLVGPHRDDLDIRIDGNLAREFGSFGQARTALLALKLAQFDLLVQALGEAPIMLLDEVFSDLDQKRSEYLGNLLSKAGQVFIATSKEWELPEKLKKGRFFEVKNNQIIY